MDRTVSELVAADEGPRGFCEACAASKEQLIERQINEAIDELSRNPHCVDSAFALHDFKARYSMVPSDKLNKVIEMAWEQK